MSARFPVQDLADLVGLAPAAALESLGVAVSTITTYRLRGIPLQAATRLAAAVGREPAEVWPCWHTEIAAAEADRRRRTGTDPAMVSAGLTRVLHRIRAHNGDSPLSGVA